MVMLSELRKINIKGELRRKVNISVFYVDVDLAELAPDLLAMPILIPSDSE